MEPHIIHFKSIVHSQMRTMVLEYLPTFTYIYLKKGPVL